MWQIRAEAGHKSGLRTLIPIVQITTFMQEIGDHVRRES
jgi:hypothetical protein